jgi:hypothetical protein
MAFAARQGSADAILRLPKCTRQASRPMGPSSGLTATPNGAALSATRWSRFHVRIRPRLALPTAVIDYGCHSTSAEQCRFCRIGSFACGDVEDRPAGHVC